MTRSIRFSKMSKGKTIKTTVMHVAVLALMTTAVVGCNRGIKPVVNDPVKLVQIAQPISVLQPVFSVDVGNKKASKKDPLNLQVGYGNEQIITASRGGDLTGFNTAGQRLWSVNVDDQITGGVTLDEFSQTAIISTRGGLVMAFDSATGAKRWQKQLSGSVLTPALISIIEWFYPPMMVFYMGCLSRTDSQFGSLQPKYPRLVFAARPPQHC